MTDVWTKLLRGSVDFLDKRGEALVATSFASPAALFDSLIEGAQAERKPALTTLRDAIGTGAGLVGANKTLFDAVTKNIHTAKDELAKVTPLLAGADFGLSEAKKAGTSLAKVVETGSDSIGKIAKQAAGGNADVENQINSIMEPWADGLKDLAGNKPVAFDSLCKLVLDIDNASNGAWKALELDLAKGRLKVHLKETGDGALGPVKFDGAEIEAFVQFKAPVMVGIALNTKMKAGLRSDPTMSKIIPGQAPTADTDSVAFQLDSDVGFTIGDGKNQRVTLPVRFAFPAVELRELALSNPNAGKENTPAQIDLTTVIAAKLGSVISVVCEGGGVSFISGDGVDFHVEPKMPDGLGIRVAAGPVVGGGFLRHQGNEYGGALQLTFAKVGITAVGLLAPDTMALLVVIGVHFPTPGIQIGFGFSINAVGGLLASERRIDIDQLSAKLKDGAVSNILLPDDPVSSAPTILDQLAAVFPAQANAFVVGPIVELGWGGKSGLVVARVGVLIAMPDPSVTILGSLKIQVPPDIGAGKTFRVVDLNVDLFATINTDEFFMKASLRNSKIAGLAISGDLALLIRWASDSAFAITAGGFFPRYAYPPKLGGLNRLKITLDPPVSWLKVSVSGYVAVTGNSVQFGGALDLTAKIGPASGEAHFALDAMFVWSPRFAFIVEFNASVSIKAFGHSVAGAAFRGTISGTKPWHVEGSASVSFLFWDVDFPVGPIEWGDHDVAVLPLIDSFGELLKAYDDPLAWSALPPAVTDAVTLLRVADDTKHLLQPFSLIQATQEVVPFDVDIKRLGAYSSTVKQFNYLNPKINDVAAPAFSEVNAQFAMGNFQELTQDQKISKPDFEQHPASIQMAPTAGSATGTPIDATIKWETFFPPDQQPSPRESWLISAELNRTILASSAVARARLVTANPYVSRVENPVAMADAGMKQVLPLAVANAPTGVMMTTTEADMVARAATMVGEQVQVVEWGLAA